MLLYRILISIVVIDIIHIVISKKSYFIMSKSSSITSTSYKFYNEILKAPKFISAPMVDQSSLPWRLFVKQHGTDLAFSQMMHAKNFCNDKNYRYDCIDWNNYKVDTMNNQYYNPDPINTAIDLNELESKGKLLDSPLIVQLAGDDPHVLVQSGKLLHHDVAAIDLNLGCPQKIAKRGNYGAYLLPNKELIVKLLTAMVKELDCPITAKIRILSTDQETLDLCQAIEATGISMLTVHGRQVTSSKLFTGPVNWEIIRKIKNKLSIPIIANGGISCYSDAIKCLEITGADGVMSSEGLLENPKLFSEEGDYLFKNDFVRSQINTVKEFISLVKLYPLPRPLNQVIRGHLFKMLFRFINADNNKDLQILLSTGNFIEMCQVIEILDDRLKKCNYDIDIVIKNGYISNRSYYMRHRDEKASKRILSLPKTLKTSEKLYNSMGLDNNGNLLYSNNTSIAINNIDINKQNELKERLKNKYSYFD